MLCRHVDAKFFTVHISLWRYTIHSVDPKFVTRTVDVKFITLSITVWSLMLYHSLCWRQVHHFVYNCVVADAVPLALWR